MRGILKDAKVRAARAKVKRYGLNDGGGLWLVVMPSGLKSWNLIYRMDGVQRRLKFGEYPAITLARARELLIEARTKIDAGRDPAGRHNRALNETFCESAMLWHERWRRGKSPQTERDMLRLLEVHVLPVLGHRDTLELKSSDFKNLMLDIEADGLACTARKVLFTCKAIYNSFCQRHDYDFNPVHILRAKNLFQVHTHKHRLIIPYHELPELLRRVAGIKDDITRCAVQLMALFFTRTKELLLARWGEFDFEALMWRIPAERVKTRIEHTVPLCTQSVDILKRLQGLRLDIEPECYVFWRAEHEVDLDIILHALYSLGYKGRMTGHGFRRLACTSLLARGWNAEHVERQLSHLVGNATRRSYDSFIGINERREMMQDWANELDRLVK